jgi:restriction endonuclease Mrr
VRELRGALRVDERGLIVTTAEFSREAVHEAAADGKAKIGLLGGGALVRLCSERGIGVDRIQKTVLKLSADELTD